MSWKSFLISHIPAHPLQVDSNQTALVIGYTRNPHSHWVCLIVSQRFGSKKAMLLKVTGCNLQDSVAESGKEIKEHTLFL